MQSLRPLPIEEVKSMFIFTCCCPSLSNHVSAMELVHAVGAKLTMPFVYSARGRSHRIKYTQKGTLPVPPIMILGLIAIDMLRCLSSNKANW